MESCSNLSAHRSNSLTFFWRDFLKINKIKNWHGHYLTSRIFQNMFMANFHQKSYLLNWFSIVLASLEFFISKLPQSVRSWNEKINCAYTYQSTNQSIHPSIHQLITDQSINQSPINQSIDQSIYSCFNLVNLDFLISWWIGINLFSVPLESRGPRNIHWEKLSFQHQLVQWARSARPDDVLLIFD